MSADKRIEEEQERPNFKRRKLESIEPKEILLELKWMVKEGYITEFSSGVTCDKLEISYSYLSFAITFVLDEYFSCTPEI